MLPIVRCDAYLMDKIVKVRKTQFYNRKVKEKPLKKDNSIQRKMEATHSRKFTLN